MTYRQITSEERYILATLRRQGFNRSEIARQLGRHRSTIGRELKRNSARVDGCYRPSKAIERTAGRRSRSRRNQRFTRNDLHRVESLLRRRYAESCDLPNEHDTPQIRVRITPQFSGGTLP
jgi:transposase, IS30 family